MTARLDELIVAWRQPNRLTVPVGVLSRAADGSFEFSYLKGTDSVDGFRPFAGLGDLDRTYRSETLFPVIANRLMPRARPDYPEWIDQLGLSNDADLFEILGRSGGLRVTDHVELLPYPQVDDGELVTRFFVRGIRHLDGAALVARSLAPGDCLRLRDEPENPVDPDAMLLDAHSREPVGYLPDYLTGTVHSLRAINGELPVVVVDKVNPDAPPTVMVLVTMTAPCPSDFEPLGELDLQVVAS